MKTQIFFTTLFFVTIINSVTCFAQSNIVGKYVQVFTTAEKLMYKLKKTDSLELKEAVQPSETDICVFVNPNITFQTILGIGGAITDASAEVFAKIPKEKQKEFLQAYYSQTDGIAYSLARTTIHSCDFSSQSYTYVKEGDKELKSFDIEHDKKYRIPLLKKALQTAEDKLTIFASPWSPPAFMKNTNNILRGGKLLPEFYESWALYFTKFIKAYKNEGIPIWGISIQNEPMAVQTWESCIYTAEEERDFLKNHLGPIMEKEGLGEKKIIVWDHNRDLMVHRANVIFTDPQAAKYAWGMGFHWYETWTGGNQMFTNVKAVHESFPNKNLIFTEGCVEKFSPEKYFNIANAERYGKALINDFNNGANAWCDWNILLDEKGGPNHVGNFCFAPIHFDTNEAKLIYTPSYYYIGHFSKFIQTGAKRISSVSSRSVLEIASFLNTSGKIASIVLNTSDSEVKYNFYVENEKIELSIPAHAIQTLLF